MLLHIGVQANYFKMLENNNITNTSSIICFSSSSSSSSSSSLEDFLYNLLKTHKLTLIRTRYLSDNQSRVNFIKVNTSLNNIDYIVKTISLQNSDTLYINPFKNKVFLPFDVIKSIDDSLTNFNHSGDSGDSDGGNNNNNNNYDNSHKDKKIYELLQCIINKLLVEYRLNYQMIHINVNFTLVNTTDIDIDVVVVDSNSKTTDKKHMFNKKFIIDEKSLYMKYNLFLPSIEYTFEGSNNFHFENDSLTVQFSYIVTSSDNYSFTSLLNDLLEKFISFIFQNENRIEKIFLIWLHDKIKDFIQ